MSGVSGQRAVSNARSVATAANSLLYSLQNGGDLDDALDLLEGEAARTVGQAGQGFDEQGSEPATEESVLAEAVSQLSIGSTLLTAQAAVTAAERVPDLESAVAELEGAADGLELLRSKPGAVQGFDTSPGGVTLDTAAAAMSALAEMADAAGGVVTAVLDKTLKPLVERVPENFKELAKKLDVSMVGKLARWGLRAVRKGLDLLQRLVDLDAIAQQRTEIDSILARLGMGEDVSVLAGWFIGADDVRSTILAQKYAKNTVLVGELAGLTDRFVKICTLLRQIALLIAGLTTVMAFLNVAIPHAVVLTSVGLALVLGVTVVLGRSYTGVIDLPGTVRGVRPLLQEL